MKPGDTGLVRIVKATGYTWAGLKAAWRQEAAFRQEVLLLALMVPAAAWVGRTLLEKALLIGVGLLVLVVELLNSAIEAAIGGAIVGLFVLVMSIVLWNAGLMSGLRRYGELVAMNLATIVPGVIAPCMALATAVPAPLSSMLGSRSR